MRAITRVLGCLAAPGWQGWSAIFSGLTLLAAVSVSVILFRFAQQEEEKRVEATRANFWTRVDVVEAPEQPGVPTHEWELEINLWNEGPAEASVVRVDFVVGGRGVEAISEPLTSHAPVRQSGGTRGEYSSEGEWECMLTEYELRVEEPVLPGDWINFMQRFRVDADIDSELVEHPELLTELIDWREGLRDETLVGVFLRSVRIQASNANFYYDWPSYGDPCWPLAR